MRTSPEEEEVEEWGRWACEVDVVVYKEITTNPFLLLSPGIMRSDVVLFSMCEVKSFDIPLVLSKKSIWKGEHGHDTLEKSQGSRNLEV